MKRMVALLPCLLLVAQPMVARAETHADADADAAVAAAEASVHARLGGAADDGHATVTGRPRLLKLPEGRRDFVARAVDGAWPRRRFTVDVDVSVNGRVVRTVPISFELSQSGSALAYTADLRSHALAGDVVLEPKEVDLAKAHGTPVTDPAAMVGLRLRHAVRGGDIAVAEDFEAIPDIDNRQRVRVLASHGAIRLESGGLALRSGNRGDRVTVQVDGGERPVDATVIDKGVAEVVP